MFVPIHNGGRLQMRTGVNIVNTYWVVYCLRDCALRAGRQILFVTICSKTHAVCHTCDWLNAMVEQMVG